MIRIEILLSFTKALAYRSQGDLNGAWDSIQRTISAAEKISQPFAGTEVIYLLASQIQLERNNYDEAHDLINRALALNPDYAKAYLALGDLYYAKATAANIDLSQLDPALESYLKAHEIPNQPEGAYIPFRASLGMANVMLIKALQTQVPELFQTAEEYYNDAIKEYEQTRDPSLRPYAATAYFGLGTVHEKQGELDQALQAYQKAYDLADNEEFRANIQVRLQEIQR